MKYLNIKRQFAFLAVTALFVTSCKKVEVPESMGTAGQTLVKLVGGGTTASPGIVKSPIDFKPIPVTLLAADLRRDIPNETELNKTMHVVIKDDTAAVRTANSAYVVLPAAWYTIGSATPKTGGVGGSFNITMNPAEFNKPIYITIPDATVLDPSTLYALGFTITTVDAGGKISATNTTVIEIGAKNPYDGVYHVTGTLSDVSTVAGANLFGPWTPFWEALLVTTGANTCDVYDNTYTGLVAHPFYNNGSATYFGSFGIKISFDPSTYAVSNMINWWGIIGNAGGATGAPDYAASNTRRVLIDPSGVNKFNTSDDSIDVKYWMIQPSVMGSNTPRVYFNEHWQYIGPR